MKKNKTVLVYGNFNVVHPGHLRLLRFAKECGETLIVAIFSDRISMGSTLVPENLRLEGVKSHGIVNKAFIWDATAADLIKKIKPDIVVKGKEHETSFNPEIDELKRYGGKLIFSSGESFFSSLELLNSEILFERSKINNACLDFMQRHHISKTEIKSLIEKFSKIKVCVVGDLIVDEYISCDPIGMSQEDPTIVVTPIKSDMFIGGAGIVAAHAAQLGARVSFVTLAGDDKTSFFARSTLSELKVDVQIVIDELRPTTLKQRYRSKGKTLLKVSHLHQDAMSKEKQNYFLKKVRSIVKECDLIVFSDFNYGCLPQELVDEIINYASKLNILMTADSQSSSQLGDIARFKGMNLITPTEREARLSCRDQTSGLSILIDNLRKNTLAENVILKMGEEGALIHTKNSKKDETWHTDKIGAMNNHAKDTAGAGDSMLIVASLALACGASIWTATYLGSVAAGIQVGRVGNKPISASELMDEIRR